jgi:putative tryptophan/tyrosine transport system substrate-binding protein
MGAAGALIAFSARSQQLRRVAFFSVGSPTTEEVLVNAFRDRLRELGWVEGKSLVLELLFANGKFDALPGLAKKLVASNPDVLVAAGGTPAVLAAREATSSIPVVFPTMGDPIGAGVAASLSNPGGNFTGIAIETEDAGAKQVQLLQEALPHLREIVVLTNSSNPGFRSDGPYVGKVAAAIRMAGLRLRVLDLAGIGDIPKAIAMAAEQTATAVLVIPEVLLNRAAGQIAREALANRVPVVFYTTTAAAAGALVSFGASTRQLYARAAEYVDRILKGANPAELPIEHPTKYDLIVNLKTARALGLELPASFLARADEVIE